MDGVITERNVMQEPIKWLDDNACLIDGKVWVIVIDPRLTVGLGNEMRPVVFGTEEEYRKSQQKCTP